MTGKERKDVTFAGCAIPEMCRPRAKRRPVKNCVVVRATACGSDATFSSLEMEVMASATRFGIVRAARIVVIARMTRDAVVPRDGKTGV
jgi:hypothetical protein